MNLDIAKELGLVSKENEKITIDIIRGRKQAVKPESITEARRALKEANQEVPAWYKMLNYFNYS